MSPQSPVSPTNPQERPVQYLKGFGFLFEDPNFKNNLLIGSVFLIIPIIGSIVLLGWFCEILQRLVRRHAQPIPRLDFADFVHYLGRGLIPFLVNLVATFFMMVVVGVIYLMFFLLGFSSVLVQNSAASGFLMLMAVACGLVILLTVIIGAMVLINAAITGAYLTENISVALDPGRVWSYARRTWKKMLIAQLVYIPLCAGIMMLGTLMCYIGTFPATVIVQTAFIYLCWQIYEYDLSRGGSVLPVKAAVVLPSEQIKVG